MTMKAALVFAVFFLSTAASTGARAETYIWKDSNGKTIISDTPAPGVRKEKPAPSVQSGYAPPPEKQIAEKPEKEAAEAPKTLADKNLEFKKRQQEAKEKTDKAAKEQAMAAQKRDNCERARRNVAALETQQPVASLNDKGERVIMDADQRYQEMERSRRIMEESCK